MNFDAFLVGILIAVLYVELTEIYPGGIIVPAFLAAYLDQPLKILATVIVAYLAYSTYVLLSRHLILFGKRRFVLLLFFGVFWVQVFSWVIPGIFEVSSDIRAVGWIVPGLLANNLERQRHLPTLAGMLTVTVMTYFMLHLLRLIVPG